MKLHLIFTQGLPGSAETALSVAGHVLTVGGVPHDLTTWTPPDPEAEDYEASPILQVAGPAECTVRVILGDNAALHQPTNITITVGDGPVTIPAVRIGSAAP